LKSINLKCLARDSLRSIGYDLKRYDITSNPHYQIFQAIQKNKIDLIFDVGSNTGQFAKGLREVGYKYRIVSFEPLSSAHRILTKVARDTKGWEVHERCAIGDINGSIKINISGNSVSSSILTMLPDHSNAAPESAYIKTEETRICTLDSLSPQYMTTENRTLIKIDTQGFEWQVLDGALKTISCAQAIMIELSLVELYSGQRLWEAIIERLESEGFHLWSLQPAFVDPHDGRTLQLDGLFFREINYGVTKKNNYSSREL